MINLDGRINFLYFPAIVVKDFYLLSGCMLLLSINFFSIESITIKRTNESNLKESMYL